MASQTARIAAIGLAVGFWGFSQRSVAISVTNHSRPLVMAADQLQLLFGIPVSYEDVHYSFAGDLEDRTNASYRQTHPGALVLIPKGATINSVVSFVPIKDMGVLTAGLQAALQSVVSDHQSRGNPGEFQVIQLAHNGGFDIVPTGVRGEVGVVVRDESPLGAKISFPRLERDGVQILQAICDAVTSASGRQVSIGFPATGRFRNQVVVMGAENEVARDVLARTLAGLHWRDPQNIARLPRASWRLLYGPDVHYYALNIAQVMVETQAPDGKLVKKPVYY